MLSGVTGFSNTSQGTSDYVAQTGDSMEIIAQRVYGDTSLWYVVADANGFDEASDVPAAGQILKLPEVTTNSNTAETFKPYNPRQISGSTTPSLPQAPMAAPSAHHCSTLAEIVVIAVVIVVSIYTAGAAAEAFGATEGSAWAAGTAALTGTSSAGFGAGVAAAAIGGAAGNAAGQLVGDAEGVHQGFSWGEVASAGLTAGATAGIGGAIGNDGTFLNAQGGLNAEGYALEGAADYAAGAGANKLVGQPAQFNWANLVASAAGSAITGEVHLPTNTQLQEGESSGNFFRDLGGSLLNGAIDSETARLLGGDAANGNQIAIDAFGNALGNAAVNAVNEAEWKAAEPSVNKQADSIIGSIIGNATSSVGFAGLSENSVWQNGTLFGNAGLNGWMGSPDSSAAGDYSMIVTGDSPKGYPVPVAYTDDPAVISALYKNTVAYVNYQNNQQLNVLPYVPAPWDSRGLIDYNHALQHGLYPQDYMQTLSAINVVPTSEMQRDVAMADARQAETEAALSSLQGSFGGDLAYNAMTLLTRGGNDLVAGVESMKDILTDRMSAEQAVIGFGTALYDIGGDIAHPVNTYNRAVGAVSDWFAEPLDQQARDIGRFGIDTLLSFGAEGIAAKGLGYIDTLADGFGSVVNGLGEEPMIGSLAAQRGAINVTGDLGETRVSSFARASAIDPMAAFREANPISSRVLDVYQRVYTSAGARLAAKMKAGRFAGVPPRLLRARMGQFADTAARDALLDELAPGGELEDLSDAVVVNRRLYYTSGRGYRVPDVYVPSEGIVLDGTIGFKNATTPQVRGFFRGGARNVVIVKPNEAPLLIPQSAWIGN